MLSYYFPPAVNGGVFRPYSIYKYIPEFKINPIIITNSCYGYLDDERNIYRFDALVNWPNGGSATKKIILKVIRELIIKIGLLQYWDYYWQRNVLNNIDAIIKKNDIQLIYSTYPPADTLKVGQYISKKYNLPFVTEFRDGLAYEPLTKVSAFHHSILNIFEAGIINSSSCIITIGKNLSAYFISKYPEVPVHTVYNGFDPNDFEQLEKCKHRQSKKINLFNFGSICASKKRSVIPLFQALSELVRKGVVNKDTFALNLIGRHTKHELKMVKKFSLDKVVHFFPTMDKKEGFKWICKDADYLLFYGVDGDNTNISSKLPEYLNLGKPIIGICQGNEAEMIIRSTGTGEVCDFSKKSILGLLIKCVKRTFHYKPDSKEIAKFDRIKQAGQLAEILLKH